MAAETDDFEEEMEEDLRRQDRTELREERIRKSLVAGKRQPNTLQRVIHQGTDIFLFYAKHNQYTQDTFDFTLYRNNIPITTIRGYYFPWATKEFREVRGRDPRELQFHIYSCYDVTADACACYESWYMKEASVERQMIHRGLCGTAHIGEITTEVSCRNQGLAHLTLTELMKVLPGFKKIKYVTVSAVPYCPNEKDGVPLQKRWEEFFVKKHGFKRPANKENHYTLLREFYGDGVPQA